MGESFSFADRPREESMRISVQIDGEGLRRLKDLAEYEVPDARRRMVERGMEATLESTIQLNPVETGRSRAAWKAALDQLRGGGFDASAASGPIGEGMAQRFTRSSARLEHDNDLGHELRELRAVPRIWNVADDAVSDGAAIAGGGAVGDHELVSTGLGQFTRRAMISLDHLITTLQRHVATELPEDLPLVLPGIVLDAETTPEWIEFSCDAIDGVVQRDTPAELREISVTLQVFVRASLQTTRVHALAELARAIVSGRLIDVIDRTLSDEPVDRGDSVSGSGCSRSDARACGASAAGAEACGRYSPRHRAGVRRVTNEVPALSSISLKAEHQRRT